MAVKDDWDQRVHRHRADFLRNVLLEILRLAVEGHGYGVPTPLVRA